MTADAGVVVGIAVLLAVGVAASFGGELGHARGLLTAGLRALLQLGALSLVLAAVLRSVWLTLAFFLLMLNVASFTSARRTGGPPGGMARAAVTIGVPAGCVLAIVLLTGAVPLYPPALLPVGGIVIGGSMTATTLAGRRALADLSAREGEVDAALALGLQPREAARLVLSRSAADALVPALDQTRTAGLVTLPGVFVGLLLGGATPLEAGVAQLLVFVALLAAEAMAAGLTVELFWRACWNGSRISSPPVAESVRRDRPVRRWRRAAAPGPAA